MAKPDYELWLPAIPDNASARPLQVERRQRQLAVLDRYAETGNIHTACYEAGVAVWTHKSWMRDHNSYRLGILRIREHLGDKLEGAVYDRALNGVDNPVYKNGEIVGTYKHYDVGRESLMLRALKPHVYGAKIDVQLQHATDQELRDKVVEILGKAGIDWDGDPAKLEAAIEAESPAEPGEGGLGSDADGDGAPEAGAGDNGISQP